MRPYRSNYQKWDLPDSHKISSDAHVMSASFDSFGSATVGRNLASQLPRWLIHFEPYVGGTGVEEKETNSIWRKILNFPDKFYLTILPGRKTGD